MKNRLVFLAILCLSISVSASAQIFLKATDANGNAIDGEATTIGVEKQINVSSYSEGISSCPNSGGVKGKCTPTLSDLSFTMEMSNATNAFKQLLLTGGIARTMEFTFIKPGGDGRAFYYKIKMEDVSVTSVQESSGGERPFVSVSLNSARIAWGYRRMNDNNGFDPINIFGWDIVNNKPWSTPL